MRPSNRSGGSMRWSSTEMIGNRRGRGSGSGSSGIESLGALAHDPAGTRAGVVAVALHDLAADDGGDEPVGALQHALGARGEVVHHLDGVRRDRGGVDHVEVGLEPGLDRAAVAQAVHRGRFAGEDLDRGLERERAAGAVAHPVGEEERRVAGVADEVDVGAAVAEAEHARRVHEQLGADVEVAGVAAEEEVDEGVAVARRWSSRRGAPRGRTPRAARTARRGWSTGRARTPAPGATGRPTRPTRA